jgi:hypothetical protein
VLPEAKGQRAGQHSFESRIGPQGLLEKSAWLSEAGQAGQKRRA